MKDVATLYRVKDNRGRILLDLQREHEARAAVIHWNSRPIAATNPAHMVELQITIKESRLATKAAARGSKAGATRGGAK